jgi:predicted  nucleic acid-binding Zn-ribbon protein
METVSATERHGGAVHADVDALLALQSDDAAIHDLEVRRAGLAPRLQDLERQRQVTADALARARHAVESEEKRQRELQARLTQHKDMHARYQTQMEQVRTLRESTAAQSQVDQVRRIVADEESELANIGRRIGELRVQVEQQERAEADLDAEQSASREAIEIEAQHVDAELAEARAKRSQTAGRVSASLLAKYDRILKRRRKDVVFALRGGSCSNCDTAIPLQRRTVMQRTGAVEMCEACGVLLYARD